MGSTPTRTTKFHLTASNEAVIILAMYKYTLKPYLRKRVQNRDMPWGFVHQLLHDAGMERDYSNYETLARRSNVTFFSKKKVLQVPASNGILLPVVWFDEVEI